MLITRKNWLNAEPRRYARIFAYKSRIIMSTTIVAPDATVSTGNPQVSSNEAIAIRSAADVARLVNGGAAKRNDARIVVAIALGGVFLDAYDLGALAFGIKDVAREFNLSPTGTGLVASAITFGAIIGAFIGGYLTDKIGRYRVFMADMFSLWWPRWPARLPPTNGYWAAHGLSWGWGSASTCR